MNCPRSSSLVHGARRTWRWGGLSLTLEKHLDKDLWRLAFQGLADRSDFLRRLWPAVWEHKLDTRPSLCPWRQLKFALHRRRASNE